MHCWSIRKTISCSCNQQQFLIKQALRVKSSNIWISFLWQQLNFKFFCNKRLFLVYCSWNQQNFRLSCSRNHQEFLMNCSCNQHNFWKNCSFNKEEFLLTPTKSSHKSCPSPPPLPPPCKTCGRFSWFTRLCLVYNIYVQYVQYTIM